MTRHTPPTDPGPRLPSTHDPSELLAETRLSLCEPPSDCLILAGEGLPGVLPLLTRSPLRDLLATGGGDRLEEHLELLRRRGVEQVRALVVVGDGYQAVLESVSGDVLRRAGAAVRAAAAAGECQLLTVSAAANGAAWELLPLRGSGREEAVEVLPVGPLREFSDTRAAAAAVLRGRPIGHEGPPAAMLEGIGRSLRLPVPDLGSRADPGALFSAARGALEHLRRGDDPAAEAEWMTECEPIAALLSALAVDRLQWELLAQCVEHGGAGAIDRESLLQVLVSDPRWTPHADVCAGGSWYSALGELRLVAAAASDHTPRAERATARSAWRALTSLLVLLAWWNHRFATAGGLIDELRDREPDSTLAPLLSRMTDTPIRPAWWPSR
ncbi:hypothetical protein [Brachybacterium sp. YJGR34]|uniref:hypothetical protein n=1 Tax=Brachybacterium sp. YJGR34 TaxID=2059911 RepID=UPI000E0A5571|nr:hypothetical protein [Brachybacterium sp. YJGR34]